MKAALLCVIFWGVSFLAGSSFAQGKRDIRIGKILFERHCTSCHGRRGEGLGPGSNVPNFTDPRYMQTRTDQEFFDKVTFGGQGTGMPAWKNRLSEEERWSIVVFLRTLTKK